MFWLIWNVIILYYKICYYLKKQAVANVWLTNKEKLFNLYHFPLQNFDKSIFRRYK